MRKVITLSAELCEPLGFSDWRQHRYNIKHCKRLMRSAQNKKRSSAKSDEQKKRRDDLIKESHQNYIDVAQKYLDKACLTLKKLENKDLNGTRGIFIRECIEGFIDHAVRQIDQIKRRVILGEVIPHQEKVFSLFQPHTEWIVKGKAGVPVELGLRVCIAEDQHQFILHHQVMEKQTDDQVAIPLVDEMKSRFADFTHPKIKRD